jgi:small subunit ribosomal protein S8
VSKDTIANMITSIRNSTIRKDKIVEIPATNMTRSIAKILLQEGFISNLRERHHNKKFVLILTLRYQGREISPCITSFKQVSKPGLRVYTNRQDIPRILGGIGMVILSTSKGIMIDRKAREEGLGGEILCYIW